MQDNLSKITSVPQKEKGAAYSSLLAQTILSSTSLLSDLTLFLDSVLSDSLAQIVARPALADYVTKVSQLDDRTVKKEVMGMSLSKMQPRVTSFEEQVCYLREQYADLLEQDDEYPEAAKVLIGIPLESGSRTNEYKLGVYIRIVRLFLEEEDSTSAETYFNRASLLYHTTTDLALQLHFKLAQARMFDYSRRFVEAASKYHEISYVPDIPEDERLGALSAAITCAVLAPAGPNRSRILSSLYRDERASSSEHYTILSKMFLDQIIRPSEVSGFASTLKTHQLAKLPPSTTIVLSPEDLDNPLESKGKKGPETVLDRAVMEHNVLSASRIYNNITFGGLGLLLDLRPSAAESMARTMIQQGRLKGSIDQVEKLIVFDAEAKEGDGVVSNVAALAGAGGEDFEKEEQGTAPATLRWDLQVRATLQMVETVAERCEVLLKRANLDGVALEGPKQIMVEA